MSSARLTFRRRSGRKFPLVLEHHRRVIAKHWRSWEVTRLPGFNFRGLPDGEPLSAFCAKQFCNYWVFRLDYDELDTDGRLGGVFDNILENCGPPGTEIVGRLWQRYEPAFSPRAELSDGGWRWWSGHGLSKEMVEELRALLVARYARAREILATYVPDPKWPGSLMPPSGWPHRRARNV
jgi:hypothetical protein